jgi:hypothetical protein
VLELFANRPHQNGQTTPPQVGCTGRAPRLGRTPVKLRGMLTWTACRVPLPPPGRGQSGTISR